MRFDEYLTEDELIKLWEKANIKKAGDKIKVPHKGKIVQGKVVRYDKGDPHGGSPYYVVNVGEYESIKVPVHKVNEAPIAAKGWTQKSVSKFGKTVGKDPQEHGFFDACVTRMSGKEGFDGDKAKGFCASVKDASYGSAHWRGKGKSKKDIASDTKKNKFKKQLKKG